MRWCSISDAWKLDFLEIFAAIFGKAYKKTTENTLFSQRCHSKNRGFYTCPSQNIMYIVVISKIFEPFWCVLEILFCMGRKSAHLLRDEML